MTLLVLFDIDGTLLRAGDPVHSQAMRDALREVVGETVSLDGIPLAGMLDREIARRALVRHGLRHAEIDRLLPLVMQRMGKRYAELLRPGSRRDWVLPGVRDLLELLRLRGHCTGVLTGNAERVARTKLGAADLAELLPFGAYGDQAEERHQLVDLARAVVQQYLGTLPPPERTILVGDTPRDIAAAQKSGARVLAVATGRFTVAELRTYAPDAVVADLSEGERILQLLERLGATR